MTMTRDKALELAHVLRTLKDERTLRTRSDNGIASPDDTALALSEAQHHFEDLANGGDA